MHFNKIIFYLTQFTETMTRIVFSQSIIKLYRNLDVAFTLLSVVYLWIQHIAQKVWISFVMNQASNKTKICTPHEPIIQLTKKITPTHTCV